MDSKLNLAQGQVTHLKKMLESNNPKLKSKVGYAQISKNKKLLDVNALEVDDVFEAQSSEYVLSAKVLQKTKI